MMLFDCCTTEITNKSSYQQEEHEEYSQNTAITDISRANTPYKSSLKKPHHGPQVVHSSAGLEQNKKRKPSAMVKFSSIVIEAMPELIKTESEVKLPKGRGVIDHDHVIECLINPALCHVTVSHTCAHFY